MELKPCPFCGGEAELVESTSGVPFFSIWCKNENCIAGAVQVKDFDKERLVNAWNTRAERTCTMSYDWEDEDWCCSECDGFTPGVVTPLYCSRCGAKVVE